MMKCPRDGSVLETKTFGQTSVEACPLCRGMFFEHGHLNAAVEPTPGDLEFSTVDGDSFEHRDDYGPIACPRDGASMSKVDFNVDSEIILDYCRTCGGFWLDEKELASINEEVKRLNSADQEIPDPLLVRISQFFWNFPLPH
jgi:Zn-finger nucleic acid-binding protein